MTNINFDEPSEGIMNSGNTITLKVKNNGLGSHCLWAETTDASGGARVIGSSKKMNRN